MGYEERRVYQGRNSGMAGTGRKEKGDSQMQARKLKKNLNYGGGTVFVFAVRNVLNGLFFKARCSINGK
jgi:hypothetical protein